jgi:hypothetical protein
LEILCQSSQLIKTQRFEHFDYKNGWAKKIFVADTNGTFILVNFESKYKYLFKQLEEIINTNKFSYLEYMAKNIWFNDINLL